MKNKEAIELYIHIPFCVRKCNYCDFLSFAADEATKEAYVDVLCDEISTWGSSNPYGICPNDFIVDTIFIGGGTPSILKPAWIKKIMTTVRETFAISEEAEISIESNPGTLTREKLETYLSCGINRLSMGLQSADDTCLQKLGRIHTFAEFLENYFLAREVGFQNINIDMMSALPGQTYEGYLDELWTVAELHPEHLSAYSLILEEGTPFYEDDEIYDALPDEDTERLMYQSTEQILAEHGYRRYEISNYAIDGHECRHNLGYWSDVPYIGFGLGASSYVKTKKYHIRYANQKEMKAYLNHSFIDSEQTQYLSIEDRMEEYMFLGLRRCNGISISEFQEKFDVDIHQVYGEVIQKYCYSGHLTIENDTLKLTKEGIDISNVIFSEFLF